MGWLGSSFCSDKYRLGVPASPRILIVEMLIYLLSIDIITPPTKPHTVLCPVNHVSENPSRMPCSLMIYISQCNASVYLYIVFSPPPLVVHPATVNVLRGGQGDFFA